MPHGNVVRVGGGCGVQDQKGARGGLFTLSVGCLCAVLGPKGRVYSVFDMQKNKAPKVEKYSYSEYNFLYSVTIILSKL
jgi:hypothetical protein